MGLLSGLSKGIDGLLGDPALWMTLASGGNPERKKEIRDRLAQQEKDKILAEEHAARMAEYKRQVEARQAQEGRDSFARQSVQSLAGLAPQFIEQYRNDPAFQASFRANQMAYGNPELAEQSGMLAPLPKALDPTAKMKEYEYAKQNGFSGSFTDFMQMGGGADSSLFAPNYFQDKEGQWYQVQGSNQGGPPAITGLPPGFRPQSQTTTPSSTNRLIETKLDQSQQAEQIVQKVRMAREQLSLVPDSEWNAGFQGQAAEAWKRATGSQDAQSLAKAQYIDLRNSGILNSLPPGVASDRDVALVLQGTLPANAPKAMIEQYMTGLEKVAAHRAQYAAFIADYVSADPYRGMQGAAQAWQQYSQQMSGGSPAGAGAGATSLDLSNMTEEQLKAELQRLNAARQGGASP